MDVKVKTDLMKEVFSCELHAENQIRLDSVIINTLHRSCRKLCTEPILIEAKSVEWKVSWLCRRCQSTERGDTWELGKQ